MRAALVLPQEDTEEPVAIAAAGIADCLIGVVRWEQAATRTAACAKWIAEQIRDGRCEATVVCRVRFGPVQANRWLPCCPVCVTRGPVYLHCNDGGGRTCMVSACVLAALSDSCAPPPPPRARFERSS